MKLGWLAAPILVMTALSFSLGACGDDTGGSGSGSDTGSGSGDGNDTTSGSSTCQSDHECENGACQCTTPGKEGTACVEEDCEADCQVCTNS